MKRCSRFGALLSLSISVWGAALSVSAQTSSPAAPSWKKEAQNDDKLDVSYTKVQLVRLFDGKFAELEAEAESLRKTPQFTRNGEYRLDAFFNCFDYSSWNSKPEWERFFGCLKKWREAYPSSINAKIASAVASIDYAWDARGSDFANTVTSSGWKLFGERILQADEFLQEALPEAKKCPVFWSTSILVARAANKPHHETLKLAEASLALDPLNAPSYIQTCIYLLPRWHGNPGEWQAWLNKNIPEKGEASDMLYARVACSMAKYPDREDQSPFSPEGLSWARTQKGMRLLCSAFPESTSLRSYFLLLSYYARDRERAHEAQDLMKFSYDPWILNNATWTEITAWLKR